VYLPSAELPLGAAAKTALMQRNAIYAAIHFPTTFAFYSDRLTFEQVEKAL
jgi:hypothetical protein